VSGQLFKAQKMHKAEKVYTRMKEFFKLETQKGNFAEEDVETQEYKDGLATLDVLKLVNLTNLAVCQIKIAGNSKELNYKAIQYCNEVIEIEPQHIKAHFLKGRALMQFNEYKVAIKMFQKILEFDPENADAQRELAKAEKQQK